MEDVDYPTCTECGCYLYVETDGPGNVCIACRHDVGQRWFTHDERLLKGLPAQEPED